MDGGSLVKDKWRWARTCCHGPAFDVGDLAIQNQLDSGVGTSHPMSEPNQVDYD